MVARFKVLDFAKNPKALPDEALHFFERGASGIDISAGVFSEDYLADLTSTQAADIYDEMRRSDDQVRMLLRMVKSPIISAEWGVEPASEDEQDVFLAELISHILFDDISNPRTGKYKTWSEFVQEAMSCVDFGYSLFEIVNKVILDHPDYGDYIGLKDLGWRSPRTIEEWNLNQDGSIRNVRQIVDGDLYRDAYIRGKNLLAIVPHKEGDNYEGISDLRPIYGNWFRKNFLRKLQMIGIERSATGVPHGTVPSGKIDSDEQRFFEAMLQAWVSHQKNYLITPEGWTIGDLKTSHDAEKVKEQIVLEDVGMAKSFLANFLELGLSGKGGAYALGTDLSDIFLSAITLYSTRISEAVNHRIIKPLVDAKVGGVTKYPKLYAAGINDKAGKELGEILKILSENDLIQKSPRLKAYLHKTFKLPEFKEDEEPETTEEEVDAELSEELNLAEGDNISKTITDQAKDLLELSQDAWRIRGEQYIIDVMSALKNNPDSKARSEAKKVPVPNSTIYKKQLTEFFASLLSQSTRSALSELGFATDYKFNEIDDLGNSVPVDSRAAANEQVNILISAQDADIQKNVIATVNGKYNVYTDEDLAVQLRKVVEQYITGASLRAGTFNSVSSMINAARNAVYQTTEILEEIESFIFTNSSPVAAVCKNLTGRVFTKEEYLTTNRIPPLHHNCDSYIRAQRTGRKNKPINPLGLQYTGTENQVAAIIKSKTF
jgi:hypothetical protein